ncbi:ATP-binding cassette sub-family F member 3-like, partial [Halichondria panicea]|uniref:ATP-binding cassette sub-family F member 3-like n=1 Tax=Halichondria panicea TaxID=6063 RepID=UPI00312B8961
LGGPDYCTLDYSCLYTHRLVLSGPTTNQVVSKAVEGGTVGTVTDIKIENFDIAFGNHVLLSNANLTLARRRRYGLVGRNGVGKSTLLRSMACRELRLPAGVSVLHVEQEVTRDNTLALDSVLKCDTERVQLLAREGELLHGLRGQGHSSSASDELAEVYLPLQEIDADKAPARAGCIVAGLGFTPQKNEILSGQDTVCKTLPISRAVVQRCVYVGR